MYRNIIWDLDGTIFDTYPAMARAFKAALNELGADAPLDWIENQAKISFGTCSLALATKFSLSELDILRVYREQYYRIPLSEQPIFEGVVDICELMLARGGLNLIVTHRNKTSAYRLLDASNISHYFTDRITQDAGFPKKPDPSAFQAMIDKHNLVHAETLAVGDRDLDVQAGQAAGLFSCLFTNRTSAVSPDLTFDDYDILQNFLIAN